MGALGIAPLRTFDISLSHNVGLCICLAYPQNADLWLCLASTSLECWLNLAFPLTPVLSKARLGTCASLNWGPDMASLYEESEPKCTSHDNACCGITHWLEKEWKKEKNITLLMCLQMRQWQWWDLWGLRGEAWWRGGGLRTQHVEKRGLCNTGQKRNKKRRKKTYLYLCAHEWGNGGSETCKAWGVRHGGEVGVWGPSMWGKEVSPMVRNEMKKEEKKHNFTCMPTSAGNGGSGCGG